MTRLQIKRRRLDLDLTQRLLGKRTGLSRSAIANFENGHRRISPAHMKRITSVLRHYHHFAT